MDKLKETTMEKRNTERYLIDLSKDIDNNLKESNDPDEYNYVIDDDEWGNDF